MSKALSDFTHQLPWADVEAARLLLTGMQPMSESPDAKFTARRSAAQLVTALAADEAIHRARQRSTSFGAAIEDLLGPARLLLRGEFDEEGDLENYVELVWSFRPS
jgi:hypothetical protein